MSLGPKGSTTHLFSTGASGSASQLLLKQHQQQPWRSTPPPPLSSASGSTSELPLRRRRLRKETTTQLPRSSLPSHHYTVPSLFNAQRALTSSPVIFDLTSDSEDVRKPISSGTQKRSRQEAGIGETSLTVYENTSSTSQGVIHGKGDDVVGRLRFPDKNGFIDMGQTPWRPHTNWGFRLPTKTELPFTEIQLRQAYGTDYVGGHILLPLPMPLLIHFGNNMAEFKAAFEEYLRLLRFYRVHFGDACICIWLDDPDIPIPGFPLAPPPPPPHPHSCLARTLEAIRVEELVPAVEDSTSLLFYKAPL